MVSALPTGIEGDICGSTRHENISTVSWNGVVSETLAESCRASTMQNHMNPGRKTFFPAQFWDLSFLLTFSANPFFTARPGLRISYSCYVRMFSSVVSDCSLSDRKKERGDRERDDHCVSVLIVGGLSSWFLNYRWHAGHFACQSSFLVCCCCSPSFCCCCPLLKLPI